MNYGTHALRTDLQEWKNRLYRATYNQLENQIKFFLNNISSNKQLSGILRGAKNKFHYTPEELDEIAEKIYRGENEEDIQNECHHASFNYQFITRFIEKNNSYELSSYGLFSSSDFEGTKKKIIEEYLSPIIYYLHDTLDKSNSVIYLLEKYKKRTEWFTKNELFTKYENAEKSYEQIFEDDLRLFLFDQGIEYPFSTPLSASGRGDIIGELETDDPLVVEIKIYDTKKKYGKNRIKDGFNQTVKYANDYNKDVGYLVIFNLNAVEINFNFTEKSNVFPPSLSFNNKRFYFVVINIAQQESASKSGTIKEVEILEAELTKK